MHTKTKQATAVSRKRLVELLAVFINDVDSGDQDNNGVMSMFLDRLDCELWPGVRDEVYNHNLYQAPRHRGTR